jgi:hypothetical protein
MSLAGVPRHWQVLTAVTPPYSMEGFAHAYHVQLPAAMLVVTEVTWHLRSAYGCHLRNRAFHQV